MAEGERHRRYDQAYKTLSANLSKSKPTEIHAKMVYSGVAAALIDASKAHG